MAVPMRLAPSMKGGLCTNSMVRSGASLRWYRYSLSTASLSPTICLAYLTRSAGVEMLEMSGHRVKVATLQKAAHLLGRHVAWHFR